MTFYTAYEKPNTEAAPAGSELEPVYQTVIDKNGVKDLKKTGETNIYDIIQESLEQSKIENIIRRAREGDPTALGITEGQYIDTTEIPATLAEAQQLIIKIKQEFDKLPIDTRRKFNMSAEEYVAAYGTEAWAEAIGLTATPTKPTAQPAQNNSEPQQTGGNQE